MNRSCLNGVFAPYRKQGYGTSVQCYHDEIVQDLSEQLSSTSPDWDSPSVKLICARTARAIWTILCPPSTMVLTHLFVIHKSWMFLACQNAVLAPIPSHLLINETSGKNRHKMAASVSAALFN